jgi:hypothetical protein
LIMCCVEMTAPTWLFGQGPGHHLADLGTPEATAPDGTGKAAAGSWAANTNASDLPYIIPETSITSIIEPLREIGVSGNPRLLAQCILTGRPCNSSLSCCSKRCVFHGGSTRVGYMCM